MSNEIFCENLTDIQQFYAGSTIFITGGTGFIGKLLVEKLLRSCRHLKKIYLLVREKKGKSAEQRVSELLDNKAFSRVHIFNENFKTQVELIEGCLEKDGLGISLNNRKRLAEEVNIVFHAGASIRFDMPLKYNVNSNVKATVEMLKLAHEMKNLKMFIYISTAYSFSHLKKVEEKIYDVPYKPEDLIKLINEMPDEELKKKEPEIIGKWYNSYVFTKAIAEQAVLKSNIPRIIVRPTIVISVLKEPLPGWIDTFFGPIGNSLGVALGVLHIGYMNENVPIDIVPADYIVNHMLSAARHAAKYNGLDIKIYTCSSSLQNPILLRDYAFWCMKMGKIMQSSKQMFHFWIFNTDNYILFLILHNIFHVPQALLFDFILKCKGKQPMAIKNLNRMVETFKMLAKFTTNEMIFHNENTQSMVNSMSLLDKEIFYCDISKVSWHEFLYYALKGGRQFLLNEKSFYLEDFYKGHKKGVILEYLHYFSIALILFFIYYMYKLLF